MMTNSEPTTRRAQAITWAQAIAADPNVVFLDTESTGLGDDAEIVDIGIVDLAGNVLLDALVRPGQPIPAEATAVHGITDEMVANADTWAVVGLRVQDALADRQVVIYNAAYDSTLIDRANAEHGLKPIDGDWPCAMLAYSNFDGTPNRRGEPKWHKLDAAAARFGIAPGGHRALADANTARLVVLAMANEPLELPTPEIHEAPTLPQRTSGMKLTIQQDHLASAIAQARRAVPAKTALEILGNLKLSAATDSLTVTATDLHIGITARQAAAAVETPGETTVDAGIFAAFVQSLPDAQPVDLELAGKNGHSKLNVRCGAIKGSFGVISAEDYPVLPTADASTRVTVYGSLLAMLIDRVQHSAAKDDSRPVLAGANLTVSGDRLTLATADGFALSVTEGTLKEPVETPINVIVPIKPLRELAALTREVNSDITLAVTPAASQIVAELPTTTWRSSLIEGTFPDYRLIVPRDFSIEIEVNRDDLLAAIKRARLFLGKEVRTTRFTLADGQLTIAGGDAGIADGESTILATVTGEPEMSWLLDSWYAADAIGAVTRSDLWIGLNGPNQVVMIKPDRDAKQTHVIMPMVKGVN